MATQTIEFRSVPAVTTVAKLFGVGSDTIVATVTATEASNRLGTYSAAFTDIPAGEYQLLGFVGGVPSCSWYVTLTLTTATFRAYDIDTTQVNAQVLDVLTTDNFAELAAPPAATSSLKDKLTWLFMWARNKSTESTTQRKLYADNETTVVSTEAVSDNGTTFTKGEAA